MPGSFALHQNYPNPFNPATLIRYELPAASHVTLSVFDMLGRRVATLVEGVQGAGAHQERFEASGLATGVYHYRLQAGDYMETREIIVL